MEKTLTLGKPEDRRTRRKQRMRCLGGITDSMDTILSKLWEKVNDKGSLAYFISWGCKEVDIT